MTVERAREILRGDIDRRSNLIQRMEEEKQPEADINASKTELDILQEIMNELQDN